jgi:alpha-D-ribose 1-methylphosphonate 5-triphosphate diphosphatase
MQPRPGVKWPMKAAILSHDAELASVGITTVFDALRVGSIPSDARNKYDKYARNVANLLLEMQGSNQLRISHFIHLRAEVCTETLLDELAEFSVQDRVGIVSLMDHTPGQRQFRDLSKMEEYLAGKYGMSKTEVSAHFDKLYRLRDTYGIAHEEGAVRIGKELGAVLASHDDTTIMDVDASAQKGVQIAEFPTTLEAAQECHNRNIAVMMGAPNLLRGGSHSGNVAAHELASAGVLKVLSSDYAPSSLLGAAVQLGLETNNMAQGLRTVTTSPATATGFLDRGRIHQGLRADLIRFDLVDNLPCIKGVWRQGLRVG